jgi:hypothetical protein
VIYVALTCSDAGDWRDGGQKWYAGVMPEPRPTDIPHDKLDLSPIQIFGSAAAAVAAAVVCSFFGVAGTVIGTAIASVVATTASALYAHSVHATKRRLEYLQRSRVGLGSRLPPVGETANLERSPVDVQRATGSLPWPVVLLAGFVVFVLSIGIVTAIEATAGKPLSALLGGRSDDHRETSLGGVLHSGPKRATPSPKPTPSTSPSTTPTPTPSPSATPEPTPTTVTPSPTAPPSTPSPLLSIFP